MYDMHSVKGREFKRHTFQPVCGVLLCWQQNSQQWSLGRTCFFRRLLLRK